MLKVVQQVIQYLLTNLNELFVDIDDQQTILAYCVGVNTASLTAIASGGNTWLFLSMG